MTIFGSGADVSALRDPSREVTWNYGTNSSVVGDTGYLSVSGSATAAIQFTAPADQDQRTLYIEAGGTNSQIKLTAQLSDGSAADYVATDSGAGVYTNLYSLVYQAGSANQTLTITLQKTGDLNGSGGSVDLVAAALVGPTAIQVGSLGVFGERTYGNVIPNVTEDAAGNLYAVASFTTQSNKLASYAESFVAGTLAFQYFGAESSDVLVGPLAVDSQGNLYGWDAGSGYFGSVVKGLIEIPAGSGTIETVVPASEIGSPNDDYGLGQLLVDSGGNLFVADDGLYRVAAGTHAVTTLIPATDPSAVTDGAFLDSAGDLFDALPGDKTTAPSIVEVSAGSSTVQTLATLSPSDLNITFIGESNGAVYGTTDADGKFDDGIIFEITPSQHRFTTLLNLNSTNSSFSPELGNDGNLFGFSYQSEQVDEFFPLSGDLVRLGSSPFPENYNLVSDSEGNLYGLGDYVDEYDDPTAGIFRISGAHRGGTTLADLPSTDSANSLELVVSQGTLAAFYGDGFALTARGETP